MHKHHIYELNILAAMKASAALTFIAVLTLPMILYNLFSGYWLNSLAMLLMGIASLYAKVLLRKQVKHDKICFEQKNTSENMLMRLITTLKYRRPKVYKIVLRIHAEDLLSRPSALIHPYLNLHTETKADLLLAFKELVADIYKDVFEIYQDDVFPHCQNADEQTEEVRQRLTYILQVLDLEPIEL
ncbi:MAG TPA: hypothetical protein PKD95_02255 [Candidatus Paceibacterota bacterium]|nr:hypothetical protein [Candidatus Paceibacterota bacterium]